MCVFVRLRLFFICAEDGVADCRRFFIQLFRL